MMSSPSAPQIKHVHRDHGLERPDKYHYLKDREHPETIPYLKAENNYCNEVMSPTSELQKRLYEEMLGRIQENDQSAPVKIGSYFHYTRTESGKAYRIHCRRFESMDATEEIILDENLESDGLEYYSASHIRLNPNQSHIAWLEDRDGGERFILRVREISTGLEDQNVVCDLKWSLAWGDDETLFYLRSDHAQRPCAVWKRVIFSEPANDKLVWEEPDERYFMGVQRSRNGQFVFLKCSSKMTSEIRYIHTDDLSSAPQIVMNRVSGVEYSVSAGEKSFYVRTNNEAQNFRLLQVDFDGTVKELISHQTDVLLYGVETFANCLVLWERYNALPRIRFFNLKTNTIHSVVYPDPVYDLSRDRNPNFYADHFRLSFTSPTRPHSILSYPFESSLSSKYEILKVYPVLGGFDAGNYKCERQWAKAPDGTKIPLTIAHLKNRKSGPQPTLMYGYGSYGSSYPVDFRSSWLSLINRGVTIVIAHIRGGSEMGRHWYENGKFFQKKNTFSDFISAAEHLIETGLTNRELLAITGGSAGGLLMGAVTNKRPDLFCACVARVPFVDVINTMMDDKLPLTVTEYEEWGDPNERQVFDYMLSYSPYDNIQAQDYPSMMITGGLNDPRVGYWEPAKWAAKLRELKTDSNTLILKTNMGAGHGGASGRYGHLEDLALMFAFILNEVGLANQ